MSTTFTIEDALRVLIDTQPKDSGKAFIALRDAGIKTTGSFFNAVKAAYAKHTGTELPKSHAAAQREKNAPNIKWAHNASATQVKQHIKTMEKPDGKFWAAWGMIREGKWAGSKALSIETDFAPHFTEGKAINAESLAIAIGKLAEGKPTTRLEAFNILNPANEKGVAKNVYNAAVREYENLNDVTLETSAGALESAASKKAVHNMTAPALKKHMASMGEPDQTFWNAWNAFKEGKWEGQIERKDMSVHFQSTKETGKGAERDSDIPF